MHQTISSSQNKAIKHLLQLQKKSRNRKKEGVFVIEGLREINLALSTGYEFKRLYICPELLGEKQRAPLTTRAKEVIEISEGVYKKIAYRGSTEGVLGLVKSKPHELSSLQLKTKNPLVLVAEAPEKPGNIGALLRTADAANLDAVLIANLKTDLYNPNIIRSSVGTVFTNKIATGTSSEIIAFLKKNTIGIYCAALQASKNYTRVDYANPTALVVGTEANGLRQEWLDNATQNVIIPMSGKIDSMNVSVSAGILIFEAIRQRKLKD